MTNYERIKNMTIDEMADAIAKGVSCDPCDYCPFSKYHCDATECYNRCYDFEDSEIIQKWLESEAEE